MTQGLNADQSKFWNSGSRRNWVRRRADLDTIHGPTIDLLLGACAPRGERALNVGCGAGASTFALARAVAPTGRALDVDISVPLVGRAEARRRELDLSNVNFEVADA